jgi:hypothetical protein
MSDDERQNLQELVDFLKGIAELAKGAPHPTRAILTTNLFLAIQKVRYLLGEKD